MSSNFPIQQILKRLEILQNYILLEDMEDIARVVAKLKPYSHQADLAAILKALESDNYSSALSQIKAYLNRHRGLSVYQDPTVAALKLEVKALEIQVYELDNEKISIQKELANFHHHYTLAVGSILREIFRLRMLKAEQEGDEAAYEEARQDEESYSETLEAEQKRKVLNLNPAQQTLLKQTFRAASKLCHPDRLVETSKAEATKIFTALKEAYDSNDLEKVSTILKDLEKGYFKSKSETVSEKVALEMLVRKLRARLEELKAEVQELKNSESYQKIQDIEDWEAYFENVKADLEVELEALRESF